MRSSYLIQVLSFILMSENRNYYLALEIRQKEWIYDFNSNTSIYIYIDNQIKFLEHEFSGTAFF